MAKVTMQECDICGKRVGGQPMGLAKGFSIFRASFESQDKGQSIAGASWCKEVCEECAEAIIAALVAVEVSLRASHKETI
jgi:hypothetical protein